MTILILVVVSLLALAAVLGPRYPAAKLLVVPLAVSAVVLAGVNVFRPEAEVRNMDTRFDQALGYMLARHVVASHPSGGKVILLQPRYPDVAVRKLAAAQEAGVRRGLGAKFSLQVCGPESFPGAGMESADDITAGGQYRLARFKQWIGGDTNVIAVISTLGLPSVEAGASLKDIPTLYALHPGNAAATLPENVGALVFLREDMNTADEALGARPEELFALRYTLKASTP